MTETNIITEGALDIMQLIEEDPQISQRLISKKSGFSLGKVNYCLKALIDIGYIKLHNFNKSTAKSSYSYVLTPKGMRDKITITKKFIMKKQQEFDKLNLYINK